MVVDVELDVVVLVTLTIHTVIAQAGVPVIAGIKMIFNNPMSVASKLK